MITIEAKFECDRCRGPLLPASLPARLLVGNDLSILEEDYGFALPTGWWYIRPLSHSTVWLAQKEREPYFQLCCPQCFEKLDGERNITHDHHY
jgi:hypothetical protein